MNLIILGAPGSGKGTQATLLKKKFAFYHFIMGDVLRREMASDSDLGKKITETYNAGNLLSNELLCEIFFDEIKKIKCQSRDYKNSFDEDNFNKNDEMMINGFIFDGIPRTPEQAKFLNNALNSFDEKIDAVIDLNVSEDLLHSRIIKRYMCIDCNFCTSISEENSDDLLELLCTECNGSLKKRADDDVEVFKNRMNVFRHMKDSIIEFYYDSGIKIIEINGENSVEQVFENIKNQLNTLHISDDVNADKNAGNIL